MERWRTLDGVRGLAIVLVVVGHAYPSAYGVGGFVGVTLFFVLSGFLITNLLLAEQTATGKVNLRAFYGRRALRLAPALLVYLAVVGLGFGWSITWPPLLYVGNYVQALGTHLDVNIHTWSLAVEEHFYLVWPVLLVAFPAARRWRPVAVVVACLIVWRLIAPSGRWAYFATDTNAFALGLGCLVAMVRARWGPPRWAAPAAAAGLVLLGFINAATRDATAASAARWVPVVAALLATVLVLGGTYHRYGLLDSAPMVFAGRISYALYLWHVVVLSVVWRTTGDRSLTLVAIVAAVGIAALSWRCVESPLLNGRAARRLRASRTQAPQLTPETS